MIIYKYGPIPIMSCKSFDMPKGAKIIHAGPQRGEIFAWALVELGKPTEPRVLAVAGTGQYLPLDVEFDHIATVIFDGFVWHVLEFSS